MQIVFWSDSKYSTGQTTLTTLIATMIACQKGYKTFLTSTLISNKSLEYYSLKPYERELDQFIGESNIEGLIRRIKNGKLTKEMIKDYCFSLLAHSNLDLLQSGTQLSDDEEYHQQFAYLLALANSYYHISVIDCDLDLNHPLTLHLLKSADVLVIVGDGNKYQLDCLDGECNVNNIELKSIPKIFIVNKWEKSMFKPIKKKIMGVNPMYVPYYSPIVEQANQNNLVDYMLRMNYSKKNHDAQVFLKSIEKVVDSILRLGEEKITHANTSELYI